MRLAPYVLCAAGSVLLVAGWISIAVKGEVNYTTSTVGMLLCMAGAVVGATRGFKRRK